MILADKIIRLRKKNGWSQEELAERMKVSRQAVSKWEGAQAVPDLERILQMGELFGVTTDYLLKDELEEEDYTGEGENSKGAKLTMETANAYLDSRKHAAVQLSVATVLCILSVIPLILLSVAAEAGMWGLTENFAGGIGVLLLILVVAVAVVMFLLTGFRNEPYAFLDREDFECAYGVVGMVRERQKAFRNTYVRCNVLGTCLCVLSPVPLLCGAFLSENDFFIVTLLAVLLCTVAAGVFCFVYAGTRWGSMQRILREGDFTREEKRRSGVMEAVGAVYWTAVVALFLVSIFLPIPSLNRHGWVIFPIAGVLFGGVVAVVSQVLKARSKDQN